VYVQAVFLVGEGVSSGGGVHRVGSRIGHDPLQGMQLGSGVG
jgi:hypothetical protein